MSIDMKMSAVGREKLMLREGERLVAYRDVRGVWTIGVGHSAEAGTPPPVHKGMVITHAQADAILANDLAPREAFMCRLLKRAPTQNQFDAMQSLMFNIGDGAFEHSRVLALFNAGDIAAAGQAFMDFRHPEVLLGRRRLERAQFLA
jgi:lysozyme